MSWFRVDDNFWAHPKILGLSSDALALWLRAGSWCSQQLTDGRVTPYVMPMLRATPSEAAELVDAGLWTEDGDAFVFHDWEKYQRSRAEVLREREQARERQQNARKRARERRDGAVSDASSHAVTDDVSSDVSSASPTRPDPTRPVGTTDVVPTQERTAPAARGSRIPEPFIVTRAMRDWAAESVPAVDVDRATESFVDYWRGKAGKDAVKKDWPATWRNSMRSAADRGAHPRGSTGSGGRPSKSARAQSVIDMGERMAAKGLES